MVNYSVQLKSTGGIIEFEAEKFYCEKDGYTVFYARPAPGEKFDEVARFATTNVEDIKESPCLKPAG